MIMSFHKGTFINYVGRILTWHNSPLCPSLKSLLVLPLQLPPCYLVYQRSLWMVPKGFRVRIHVSLVPSGKLKYTSMVNCSTNNQIEVIPPKTSLFVLCSFNLESIFCWCYTVFNSLLKRKLNPKSLKDSNIQCTKYQISLKYLYLQLQSSNVKFFLHLIVSSFD